MNQISPLPARKGFLLTIISVFIILVACGDDPPVDPLDCTGISPTYTTDVKPILDASCAKSGCHDAITVQNGVDLSNYATASVISQEPRFLGVIQHQAGFPQMPFDGAKLPGPQIRTLKCWVENGSPQ